MNKFFSDHPILLILAAIIAVVLFTCLVMSCWLYWLPYRSHIGDELTLESSEVKIETDHLIGDYMAENCKP